MKSFQDQVAIVTGAGQGIGLEICRQLVRGGAKVVLNDIDDALTVKAAASITDDQSICLPLAGDASDIEFIQRMVSETVRQLRQTRYRHCKCRHHAVWKFL